MEPAGARLAEATTRPGAPPARGASPAPPWRPLLCRARCFLGSHETCPKHSSLNCVHSTTNQHKTGRMEWRSERPRHSSDRSLSAYRSLPTQPVQHREQGLWRAITLLSLFAGAVTATPQTWHHNQTLGAASYGNVGTASPASLEENSKEAPSLDAWGHWHGDNMTLQGVSSSELLRAERSPSDSSRGKKGSNKERHKKRNRHCRLHSLRLKVRDLGLGFESEELVLFSYCNGSCASARTNYDLTLQNLLQINVLTRDKHLSSNPCCRPVRYEVVSFMDVQNSWHTVDNLSAAECKCVG
uniref:Uncharacterized protein n=1 Tax=Sphaerodactylus townsendi TaxID=933632 RepID=A0ACB8F4U9_9SAUR